MMGYMKIINSTGQFGSLREFLLSARSAFDDGSALEPRLAASGLLALHTLREAYGSMAADERQGLDPLLTHSLTEGDKDLSALVARAVLDPVMRPRLVQKYFVKHCSELLAALHTEARAKVLSDVRDVTNHFSGALDVESLANAADAGWLLTSPSFIDSLFFVPGLVPTESHALLHQVPKTGGTSLNNLIFRSVPTAHLLFPCTTFHDLVAMGGGLFGIDLLNELSARPRRSLVFGGHYNLSVALGRVRKPGLQCLSQFGHPFRLLSSGLRHFLSIASTNLAFARAHGVADQEAAALAEIIRIGAHGKDLLMRDVIERVLSSAGFQDHFRDPLAKWFLPHDIEDYKSRLAKFESLVATTSSYALYERPSLRCLTDLGLVAEPGAVLERDNTSALSATALATLVGGDDWLLDRLRAYDLIGYSEQFYRYLLSHHEVRSDES